MSARTAARHLHLRPWRPFSTITKASDSQSTQQRPPTSTARPKPWHPEEDLRSLHPRKIFVRPWDGIPSMAHAFAIVRHIERQFGKIQEFVVLRDSDVLTSNMPYMHVTFAKAEYADTIPLEGRVIQVMVSLADPLRDGGVGLDDLETYLDPELRAHALQGGVEQRKEEGQVEEMPGQMPWDGKLMDIKLERSGMRDPPATLDFRLGSLGRSGPPHLRNHVRARELAEAMLAFGGFAEASSEPGQGRSRIQAVMAHWGKTAGSYAKTKTPQPTAKGNSAEVPTSADEVLWTPFTTDQSPNSGSSTTTSIPVASSFPLPPFPSLPVSPPSPSPSPSPSQSTSLPDLNPKPKPKPAPPPAAPQLSKKQRILLAARSAGAVAAAAGDAGSPNTPAVDGPVSELDAAPATSIDQQTESASAPESATREEDNKQAANKWWKFLTGGKG